MTRDRQRKADRLTALVRELSEARPDLPSLLRTIAQARPLFRASDVSVALHDPRAEAASPGMPWFAEGLPEGVAACLRDPMEGHLPLRALRRLGLATARLDRLPGQLADYGHGSVYARLLATSGRARVLLGHVGDRQSLGRIEWYRRADELPFDEEDETRLHLVLPALATAFRSLARTFSGEGEVALINAAGQLLWDTDGFRFLWNAGTSAQVMDGRLPLASMLDEPSFARPVALQILNLANPVGPAGATRLAGVPGATGERVAAEWTAYPGGPYGCVGRVMLLELTRERAMSQRVPVSREARPAAKRRRLPS